MHSNRGRNEHEFDRWDSAHRLAVLIDLGGENAMKNRTLCAVVGGALVATALLIPASQSIAALVPLSALPDSNGNGKTDIADAIAAGGFTLGDKQFVFNSSSYTPSQSAPGASDISISDATTSSGIAIKFGFGWFTLNGIQMDSRIDYRVDVLDPNPSTMIDAVDLAFNGLAVGAAVANVAETVSDTSGNQLAQLFVFTDPDGPSLPQHGVPSTSTPILPNQRSILVDKDISLFSAPQANGGNNFASVSFVDNSYHQTPEPVGLSLLGLGGICLLGRRRGSN